MLKEKIISSLKNAGISVERFKGDKKAVHDIQHLSNGNVTTIMDVGASTGKYAKLMSAIFPGTKIFSFEPLPESFEILKSATINDKGIIPINKALSDKTGVEEFYITSLPDSSSLLPPLEEKLVKYHQLKGTLKVQTIDLRSFMNEYSLDSIDVLKMDVQGHELQILKSAEVLLAENKIGIVLTEVLFSPFYKNQANYAEIFKVASDHKLLPYGFYNLSYNQDGSLAFCDVLFFNPEFF